MRSAQKWIPAFAGMTTHRHIGHARPNRHSRRALARAIGNPFFTTRLLPRDAPHPLRVRRRRDVEVNAIRIAVFALFLRARADSLDLAVIHRPALLDLRGPLLHVVDEESDVMQTSTAFGVLVSGMDDCE